MFIFVFNQLKDDMLKKCYVAIIGNEKGEAMGTVTVRGWIWHSPLWFHSKIGDALKNGNIIDFKRIK